MQLHAAPCGSMRLHAALVVFAGTRYIVGIAKDYLYLISYTKQSNLFNYITYAKILGDNINLKT